MTHPSRLRFLATVGLGFVCSLSCSTDPPAPDPVVRVGQSIMGGEDDPTDLNVVAIIMTSMGGLCSGSLIAPNLVLTARHCVATPSEENDQLQHVDLRHAFRGQELPGEPGARRVSGVWGHEEGRRDLRPDGKHRCVRFRHGLDPSCGEHRVRRDRAAHAAAWTWSSRRARNTKRSATATRTTRPERASVRSRSGLYVSCSGPDCGGFYLDKDRGVGRRHGDLPGRFRWSSAGHEEPRDRCGVARRARLHDADLRRRVRLGRLDQEDRGRGGQGGQLRAGPPG